MIDHLFYGYHNLHCRWATLVVIFTGSSLAFVFCHDNLWEIIHKGILRSCRSPIPLVIIIDFLQSIWLERNEIRYRDNRLQLPIHTLLPQSVTHVKALMEACHSVKNLWIWESELSVLKLAANPPGPFAPSP